MPASTGRPRMTLAPADIPVLQRALAQLQAGAAADAARSLAGVSASGRRHPDALYLAAIAAEQLGQPGEARRLYGEALAAAPQNAGDLEQLCQSAVEAWAKQPPRWPRGSGRWRRRRG